MKRPNQQWFDPTNKCWLCQSVVQLIPVCPRHRLCVWKLSQKTVTCSFITLNMNTVVLPILSPSHTYCPAAENTHYCINYQLKIVPFIPVWVFFTRKFSAQLFFYESILEMKLLFVPQIDWGSQIVLKDEHCWFGSFHGAADKNRNIGKVTSSCTFPSLTCIIQCAPEK